ncbi:MAG: hypothetical protein WCT08_05190 [Patescibacteria group bacterium]|jgi:hypothetical protein
MKKYFLIILPLLFVLLSVKPVQAANLPTIIPECDQTMYIIQQKTQADFIGPAGLITIPAEQYGTATYPVDLWEITNYTTNKNCDLDDFLGLFVNLFSWGLYILSALAVFFFFLGGGTLLLSGGSEERIRTGKMILTNTVIGLFVALGSWLIVNVAVIALTGNQKNGVGYIIENQPWFKINTTSNYKGCGTPPEYPCKNGNSGAVVIAQTYLYEAGCYNASKPKNQVVDGIFGPETLQALHLLQTVNSKPSSNTLDGVDSANYPVACIVK